MQMTDGSIVSSSHSPLRRAVTRSVVVLGMAAGAWLVGSSTTTAFADTPSVGNILSAPPGNAVHAVASGRPGTPVVAGAGAATHAEVSATAPVAVVVHAVAPSAHRAVTAPVELSAKVAPAVTHADAPPAAAHHVTPVAPVTRHVAEVAAPPAAPATAPEPARVREPIPVTASSVATPTSMVSSTPTAPVVTRVLHPVVPVVTGIAAPAAAAVAPAGHSVAPLVPRAASPVAHAGAVVYSASATVVATEVAARPLVTSVIAVKRAVKVLTPVLAAVHPGTAPLVKPVLGVVRSTATHAAVAVSDLQTPVTALGRSVLGPVGGALDPVTAAFPPVLPILAPVLPPIHLPVLPVETVLPVLPVGAAAPGRPVASSRPVVPVAATGAVTARVRLLARPDAAVAGPALPAPTGRTVNHPAPMPTPILLTTLSPLTAGHPVGAATVLFPTDRPAGSQLLPSGAPAQVIAMAVPISVATTHLPAGTAPVQRMLSTNEALTADRSVIRASSVHIPVGHLPVGPAEPSAPAVSVSAAFMVAGSQTGALLLADVASSAQLAMVLLLMALFAAAAARLRRLANRPTFCPD